MENMFQTGSVWIIIVCVVVLLLISQKTKRSLLFTLALRGVIGFLIITLGNQFFESMAISAFVGVNSYTLLTSAILGIPGVCALFFISFF